MYRVCEDCGYEFWVEPNERWKKLCLDCWKARKRESGKFSDWKDDRIRRLEKTVEALREEIDSIACCPPLSEIERQLRGNLRKLISCCHPDKHGGSRVAHELTCWLVDLKGYYEIN